MLPVCCGSVSVTFMDIGRYVALTGEGPLGLVSTFNFLRLAGRGARSVVAPPLRGGVCCGELSSSGMSAQLFRRSSPLGHAFFLPRNFTWNCKNCLLLDYTLFLPRNFTCNCKNYVFYWTVHPSCLVTSPAIVKTMSFTGLYTLLAS